MDEDSFLDCIMSAIGDYWALDAASTFVSLTAAACIATSSVLV